MGKSLKFLTGFNDKIIKDYLFKTFGAKLAKE